MYVCPTSSALIIFALKVEGLPIAFNLESVFRETKNMLGMHFGMNFFVKSETISLMDTLSKLGKDVLHLLLKRYIYIGGKHFGMENARDNLTAKNSNIVSNELQVVGILYRGATREVM